jgi:putative endonuclease
MAFYVYPLASKKHGTLYLGVTNDLVRRVYEHRTKAVPGFTKRYDVDKLVWFEIYDDVTSAITREKELKKWRRDWKIRLIEEENPGWVDLYPGISS